MTSSLSMFRYATAVIAIAVAAPAFAQSVGPDASLADPKGFASIDGEFLYRATCQGCHMPDGKGAMGAGTYPSLVNNPRLQSPYYPMYLVLKGQKAMPSFGRLMNDEQIASVVNYLRSHFGNQYTDTVNAAQVETLRK